MTLILPMMQSKKAKEETAALQSTNKWIVANTEAVIETDKQIKQLKKKLLLLLLIQRKQVLPELEY